jgi:hypothetical protein
MSVRRPSNKLLAACHLYGVLQEIRLGVKSGWRKLLNGRSRYR